MIRWTLTAEYLALILIGIMLLYLHSNPATARTRRRELFNASLALSAISIALNIVCTELLETTPFHSLHTLTMALNTLYFLSTIWQASVLTLYMFDLLLEHVSGSQCRRRALVGTAAVNAVFLGLMLINFTTGVVFSVDAAGRYARGPLNLAGYCALGLLMVLLLVCYVRNHASTSMHIRRVMWTMPPVVIALVAFQIALPSMLLNGTIAAFSQIIVLLNFQSQRLDTDSLTYLGDRKSFHDELMLRTAGREPFQIVSVSLRDFSSVNRRFGSQKADGLLYRLGSWLAHFDPKGAAFRYGKVSFAIVRPCRDEGDASDALERMAARFEGTWPVDGDAFKMNACCCSLESEQQQWNPEQIIDYLDAMNERGKRERLRTVRFDDNVASAVERRRYLAEELNEGIAHRRFRVFYQPILSCASGRFEGAEALLRLDDREGNPLPTGELVSLAEEMGRIDEVSWIMLDEVCRFLSRGAGTPRTVSVNLSMPQLLDPQLAERFQTVLGAYGVEPSRLKIEITERVLAASAREAGDAVAHLARTGLACVLDDFGTGYANFSVVMNLPFASAKLDRSLLAGIERNKADRSTVAHLIELFHDRQMTVVAEGVETEAQADIVKRLGADSIQGYHYARPLPEDELPSLLAAR